MAVRFRSLVACCGLAAIPALAHAQGRAARVLGSVSIEDGIVNDAFSLDASGGKLGWIHTGPKGAVVLHVTPPAGKHGPKDGNVADLSKFTVAPERLHALGGAWVVVANEGDRKAVFVNGKKVGGSIGPFGDALVASGRGGAFVTFTEHPGGKGGRSVDVAAYDARGTRRGQKQITIGADDRLVGVPGTPKFISFVDAYRGVLVETAGAYNARTDVRGPPMVAVWDVLKSHLGRGKRLPNIPRFLNLAAKRAEQPGAEVFLRLDDEAAGLELVGPAEALRPLDLPTKYDLYEHGSLRQQMAGGKLWFSLTVDPLNADQVAAQKKGERALHLFTADPRSGRAKLMAEIPLGDTQDYAWSAGGNKVAIMKKTVANGSQTITVYGF